MPAKGDTEISIPTFKSYRVEDVIGGQNITILSQTGKITIKCRWPKQVKGKFDEDKD